MAEPLRNPFAAIKVALAHSVAIAAVILALPATSACSNSPGTAVAAKSGDMGPSENSPLASPRSASTEDGWDLVSNLGVNTHLDWLDTSYAHIAKVKSALAYLGVRRIRDVAPSWHIASYHAIADAGYCFNFFIGADAAGDIPAMVAALDRFAVRKPGSICAVEGLNEANSWPAKARSLGGLAGAVIVQTRLYEAVKSQPVLKDRPVYNLSLGGAGERDYAQLGDLSRYADLGNVHAYYYYGRPPVADMEFAIRLAGSSTASLAQSAMTETGYSSAHNDRRAVNEQVQAKYILTLIAEAARLNVQTTYLYQLVDPFPDPAHANLEMGFGLYRANWTAKPAAHALHRFTRALAGGRRVSGHGASNAYTMHSSAAAQSLLFAHADGDFSLLLWRNVDIWDEHAMVETLPPPLTVHIDLPSAQRNLSLLDPMTGATKQLIPSSAGQIAIDLPGYPVILKLQK